MKKATIVNIVSISLAIISILVSIFLWHQSNKDYKISYGIYNDKSLIFDKRNASKLTLYENDTTLITQNVYQVTGFVTNTGGYKITEENVRKPLKIVLDKIDRILEYRIISGNYTGAEFELLPIDENSLNISWKYFDPNRGFDFSISYIGDSLEDVRLTGNVEGSFYFEKVKPMQYSHVDDYCREYCLVFSILFGLSVALLFVFHFLNKRQSKFNISPRMTLVLWVILSASLLFSLFFLYTMYMNNYLF